MLALVVITATATLVFAVIPSDATAQTDITVGSLTVADTETTASGNVTDVTLSTALDYNQSVPDATERIIKLRVGPSESNLQTVDFTRTESPTDGTGSVTLSGSVIDAGFTADDFDPAVGSTQQTDVVVQAVIEVQRENGETERAAVTDTATVTVHDGATVSVAIGGSGELTVKTDA